MKILIINPNSSQEMTQSIQEVANHFVIGEYEVVCKSTPGAPEFIETYEDIRKAGPGMTQLVKANEENIDAIIIACHYDPHLDVIKEICQKPVLGIGEASMRMASMLGHSFSIITTDLHSIPLHEDLVRKYHLQDVLASVRAPEADWENSSEEEMFFRVAESAVTQDMAEVIVLGCADMSGLDKTLQRQLGVPVLDGVICGLIIVSGLVKYGVSTSKIRKYNPSY